MAEWASEMRTCVGVNDLERMQPRVAHLHEQYHERHESQEDPTGCATPTNWHGNLESFIRHEARRHKASQWKSGRCDGSDVFVVLAMPVILRDYAI